MIIIFFFYKQINNLVFIFTRVLKFLKKIFIYIPFKSSSVNDPKAENKKKYLVRFINCLIFKQNKINCEKKNLFNINYIFYFLNETKNHDKV